MPSASLPLCKSRLVQHTDALSDLPIKDTLEPIIFHTLKGRHSVEDVILRFDVQPTYGSKQIVGRATALLSTIGGSAELNAAAGASGRRSGRCSVPLMSNNLEIIGMVNFEFLVATPFAHRNLSIGSKQTYWKSVATKVSLVVVVWLMKGDWAPWRWCKSSIFRRRQSTDWRKHSLVAGDCRLTWCRIRGIR